MARQDLFTEEATLEFTGNDFPVGDTDVTIRNSRVTGDPGSPFPSGRNEGKGTVTRKSNDDIEANYQGELTTDGGKKYGWTSHEDSKYRGGIIRGTEDVTFTTEIPDVPKKIKMDTEWEKAAKRVKNKGYRP
jgi:hypothetical protein